MATAKNIAKTLMGSFKELGLTAAQVRHFVPDWWNDEAAQEEGALLELQIVLSRRLNVALDSLQAVAPDPKHQASIRRFKTVHPEGSSQLAVAAGVGQGVAHVLAEACVNPVVSRAVSATDLRAQILQSQRAVTLEALCSWLWDHGIPVIHITHWPNQLRRPDAMCVRVGVRPIILVVRKELAPARLAYLVAHEVGHVMSGHLQADTNAVLVDDTLPVDKQGFASDQDERVADAYAMNLLGGETLHAACVSIGKQSEETRLAVAALKVSRDSGLDAGQVILGWARLNDDWQLASLAMRYLMTTASAPVVVNDVAKKYVNTAEISADGIDHIQRLTGMQLALE